MYVLCEDNFSHNSTRKSLILEEDLIFCEQTEGSAEESRTCLLLRLKNCTGNIIQLEDELPVVGPLEIAQAQIAISTDKLFKNQRSRTVK